MPPPTAATVLIHDDFSQRQQPDFTSGLPAEQMAREYLTAIIFIHILLKRRRPIMRAIHDIERSIAKVA